MQTLRLVLEASGVSPLGHTEPGRPAVDIGTCEESLIRPEEMDGNAFTVIYAPVTWLKHLKQGNWLPQNGLSEMFGPISNERFG